MFINSKNLVCAMNESMRTILQVTKHTGVPRQMLAKLRLSEFVLKTLLPGFSPPAVEPLFLTPDSFIKLLIFSVCIMNVSARKCMTVFLGRIFDSKFDIN